MESNVSACPILDIFCTMDEATLPMFRPHINTPIMCLLLFHCFKCIHTSWEALLIYPPEWSTKSLHTHDFTEQVLSLYKRIIAQFISKIHKKPGETAKI
jgi:hypothetical protein